MERGRDGDTSVQAECARRELKLSVRIPSNRLVGVTFRRDLPQWLVNSDAEASIVALQDNSGSNPGKVQKLLEVVDSAYSLRQSRFRVDVC